MFSQTSLLVALLFFLLYLLKTLYSPISKIPGPLHSKFTSLYLLLQEFSSNRRPYIHHLHRKYGSVVRIGPNEVSFSSFDALREIYMSGGSGYDKTKFYSLFEQFGAKTMFSTLTKGDHSQKKRYIAGQYSNTNVIQPQLLDGIQERAEAFVTKCTESAGCSLDAYIYLHCYALDCATHFLVHPYSTHSIKDSNDRKIMEELSYHDSLQQHLLQYHFPTFAHLFSKFQKARHTPLSNNYVLNTCQHSDPSPHTLLSALQSNPDKFQETDIAAECMDHLAAGIDTVGDALCFLLFQLSQPQSHEIQEKLFVELRRGQEDRKKIGEMKYLDAVVKEGLRLFPPIPMSQPRYVPKGGRIIDGFQIPGRTVVSCQAWTVQRLNEDVFPNGEQFMPARWLEEIGSLERDKHFFAFGAGGRGCTGKHLAMVEMKYLLKEIYLSFRTRVANDMRGDMSIDDQIISSRPRDQTCKLVFQPREE